MRRITERRQWPTVLFGRSCMNVLHTQAYLDRTKATPLSCVDPYASTGGAQDADKRLVSRGCTYRIEQLGERECISNNRVVQ